MAGAAAAAPPGQNFCSAERRRPPVLVAGLNHLLPAVSGTAEVQPPAASAPLPAGGRRRSADAQRRLPSPGGGGGAGLGWTGSESPPRRAAPSCWEAGLRRSCGCCNFPTEPTRRRERTTEPQHLPASPAAAAVAAVTAAAAPAPRIFSAAFARRLPSQVSAESLSACRVPLPCAGGQVEGADLPVFGEGEAEERRRREKIVALPFPSVPFPAGLIFSGCQVPSPW